MPSSLTDVNISDTYIGVLHANGQQLPSNGVVRVYDGYGNPSAISVGVSGNGAVIAGTAYCTALSAPTITADQIIVNTSVTSPNSIKAWALVQGNGVVVSQYNIATVVRNTTGVYQVSFTNPLPTANYCVNLTISHDNTTNKVLFTHVKSVPAPTTSQFYFATSFLNTGTTAAAFDPSFINITVNHL